jgi:hypothetical protein
LPILSIGLVIETTIIIIRKIPENPDIQMKRLNLNRLTALIIPMHAPIKAKKSEYAIRGLIFFVIASEFSIKMIEL